MEQNRDTAPDVGPDELLSVFSGGKMGLWVVLAVAVHVLFIGATSIGYVPWAIRSSSTSRDASRISLRRSNDWACASA